MNELEYRDDPDLMASEKEVMVRFARDDDRLTIHAEQSTVVKWLVQHPDFDEDSRRVEDSVLHAVTGTLPVGALQLSGNPRKSNQTSHVLGKLPEDDGNG